MLESNNGISFVNKLKILGINFSNEYKATDITGNIEPSIEKLKRVCSLWSKRHLSLIGKITILKSFGLSLFINLMQSIGICEQKLIEIQSICFRFIWKRDYNDKRAHERVKRKIICLEKENGGLDMFNILNFQKSFYLSWALKLWKSNEKWTYIPKLMFNKVGGSAAFNSNVYSQDFKGLNLIQSCFWKNVLSTWLDLKSVIIKEDNKVYLNSPLFNNNLITFKNRTLFFPQCFNRGFRVVKDMIYNNGKILSFELFLARYGTCPDAMLVYNAIFNALYSHKDNFRPSENQRFIHDSLILGNLEVEDTSRKKLLQLITSPEIPYVENSWKRKFDENFDRRYWILPFICTKETKLQIMQWKILHEIYPSNILLTKMKIKSSEKCELCGERDTLIHFFYECIKVENVWKEIEKLTFQKTGQSIALSAKIVLLGVVPSKNVTKKMSRTINLLILIGKHVISKGKYGNIKNFSLILEYELLTRSLI